MTVKLPDAKPVKDMLSMLFGRDVQVAPGETVALSISNPGTLAAYVDDQLSVRCFVVADLPLSVYMGAALALTPPGRAEDLIAEGAVDATVGENIAEIMNILSGLFETAETPHIKLHRVFLPGESIDPTWLTQASAPGGRLDLQATVHGYGSGQLSLVSAP